jgi:hypothetical protein
MRKKHNPTSKAIKIISVGNPEEAASAIRDFVGAKPGEVVEVQTSMCEREPGYPTPGCAPTTAKGWAALATMSEAALLEMGLRPWGTMDETEDGHDVKGSPMLWRFPGEWYSAIPAGLKIVDISFKCETFSPGITDDDIRFGCLAFGIIRRA